MPFWLIPLALILMGFTVYAERVRDASSVPKLMVMEGTVSLSNLNSYACIIYPSSLGIARLDTKVETAGGVFLPGVASA